jgi:motility quorum-sensing regulator/GCU-specific mRNA interferase toxin
MEKKKPHYPFSEIRRLIAADCWRFTHAARAGALGLGLDEAGVVTLIAGLSLATFYKSMTSHNDHKMWQDVYHAPVSDGRLAYIKLTVLNDLVIVSFKEK